MVTSVMLASVALRSFCPPTECRLVHGLPFSILSVHMALQGREWSSLDSRIDNGVCGATYGPLIRLLVDFNQLARCFCGIPFRRIDT